MTPDEGSTRLWINQAGDWQVPEGDLLRGLESVMDAEGVRGGEISVTFLGDEAIRAMNREYFDLDQPTDVIAFALHQTPEPVFGDVYVGYDQAVRQAREFSLPLEEELLRLAIHGVLHVLGYDHPKGEGRAESPMFKRQEELLASFLGGR